MRGYSMKTPERVELANELRAEGLTMREIGELLGIATSTAREWLTDPDGRALRARKDSYAQPCVDCGAPTSGSEGRRDEPRCYPCGNRLGAERRTIWTRGTIICAIREWAAEHGEPPASPDWGPSLARSLNDEARARRFEDADGRWPWFTVVHRVFGSWNAAIKAAGFEPRAAHGGDGNHARHRSVRAGRAA